MTKLNELLADGNTKKAIDLVIRLGLVLGLVIWCFTIIKPFITLILWGGIIAIAINPLHRILLKKLSDRRVLSATLITLMLLILLIVPSVMLSTTLVESGGMLADKLKDGSLQIPPPPDSVQGWPVIGEKLDSFWQLASKNLEEALEKLKPQIEVLGKWLLKAAAGAGITILQFVFSIIIAGVFLVRADISHKAAINVANRVTGSQGEALIKLTIATIRSVAQGVLGVALIQSILAGLGMLVVGVPAAGVWALLILIIAVVQLPTMIILLPIIGFVFTANSTTTAVVFTIYALIVGASDNFMKPLLLGRGVDTPMLVVLIGAIGGMISSGVIGLFVGAVVLSLGYRFFMIWVDINSEALTEVSDVASTESTEKT